MTIRTADGENMVVINNKERNIVAFGIIRNIFFSCALLAVYMDSELKV